MDIITGLQSRKNQEAYQLLLQLEIQSAQSNQLYVYFDDFIDLLKNENSFVRIRGFRLACAQAPWDVDNKIDQHLDSLLAMLKDDKPTVVRQCLTALHIVALYKTDVHERIEDALHHLDFTKYKDSMIPLLEKDKEELCKALC